MRRLRLALGGLVLAAPWLAHTTPEPPTSAAPAPASAVAASAAAPAGGPAAPFPPSAAGAITTPPAGVAVARSVALVEPPAAPAWRGIPADEASGARGAAMLYPAPNALGLLAAILTHAALETGKQSAEATARQAAADAVLSAHATTLAGLTGPRLAELALPLLAPGGPRRVVSRLDEVGEGWAVDMQPRFGLSPTQTAIVLDNALKVQAVGGSATAPVVFEGVVRVLSNPLPAEGAEAHWAADGGRRLQAEAVAMVAHSVNIVLGLPLAGAAEVPARTHRYLFGEAEKFERGQRLGGGCARVVLRNLRGALMSVPVKPEAGQPPCALGYGWVAD